MLYYTDWGDDAKVVRCYLDGSDRVVLLRGLQNPNSVAVVDGQAGMLYVVDSLLKHGSSAPDTHSSVLLAVHTDNGNWTATNLSQINVYSLSQSLLTNTSNQLSRCYCQEMLYS